VCTAPTKWGGAKKGVGEGGFKVKDYTMGALSLNRPPVLTKLLNYSFDPPPVYLDDETKKGECVSSEAEENRTGDVSFIKDRRIVPDIICAINKQNYAYIEITNEHYRYHN
jgi:hypothetical protein